MNNEVDKWGQLDTVNGNAIANDKKLSNKKLSITTPPPPKKKKCKSQGSGFTAVLSFKLNKAAKPKIPSSPSILTGFQ